MGVVYRTCPLCEATCGLTVDIDGGAVRGVRGDPDDPFSRGYLCPKAYGLKSLQEDPDRLRTPLVRRNGELQPASWDEAYAAALERLGDVRRRHGNDAVAVYLGNPSVHSLDGLLYSRALIRGLGTRQVYTASTVDQMPAQVVAAVLFGGSLSIPIPDLDRTERLLVLGGNPAVSNGSLMTAPDVPGRLAAIRARGGKVVVIDPRRTETAELADEHHFIRPGSDAFLLLSMVQVLFAEDLVRPGAVQPLLRGLDQVRAIVAAFPPERVAERTGIAADTIRRLARAQAAAGAAVCYGRVGTTCQEFGTLASWAIALINILTGNLDRPGGVMFTTPAVQPGRLRDKTEARFGRFRSRALGLPETFGELPVTTLADEVLTPGDGRVRAIVTIAGNPLVSVPDAGRLAQAFADLEARVAIDFYVNETTRLADVILPPPSPLERAAYDVALYQLAIRNVARWSPPALDRPAGQPAEWEILLTLAKGAMGLAAVPLPLADDEVARQVAERELPPDRRAEVLAAVAQRRGPERLVDLLLRAGPHALTLDQLAAAEHGLDLGPLEPRLPGLLRTPDRTIDLAAEPILADLPRLQAALDRPPPELLLINRRHLRSNNSWMHNLTPLIKGPERCTLLVHPTDAARLGLRPGARARVTSRVGQIEAPVEITDDIMSGVVSLPHGFGHDRPGTRWTVAQAHPGANVNLLSDAATRDLPSGNAALNGVPVTVVAV
jgi:anaerobic selenocysteine-containing dehydrogenase